MKIREVWFAVWPKELQDLQNIINSLHRADDIRKAFNEFNTASIPNHFVALIHTEDNDLYIAVFEKY